MSVASNLHMLLCWFSFTSHCNWSRKVVPLSQPIRFKTESNCPWIMSFSCASDSFCVFTPSSHCLLVIFSVLINCCCYVGFSFIHDTQLNRSLVYYLTHRDFTMTRTQFCRHNCSNQLLFLNPLGLSLANSIEE